MTILKELVPEIYHYAKQAYEGNLAPGEAQKKIVGNGRMNSNSAVTYIRNFKHFLKGERFRRTNNTAVTDYFLQHIYHDYGRQGLENALRALWLHIEYYESTHSSRSVTHRSIHTKYHYILKNGMDAYEQSQIAQKFTKQPPSKQDLVKRLKALEKDHTETITVNNTTYKRHNYAIALIKQLRGYTCQLCGTQIKKKGGGYYIEAAHIIPKYQQGSETLDNILILCPNHHKEFDYGDREILEHSEEKVVFVMNGKEHKVILNNF
ncbi:hypothetical protein BKI52_04395 [marine bacterium AO1-C]|nr:hypothetical protein BKI52_04395 [marine bacterium AO1-C]